MIIYCYTHVLISNIKLTFHFGPDCLKHEKEKKCKREDFIVDIFIAVVIIAVNKAKVLIQAICFNDILHLLHMNYCLIFSVLDNISSQIFNRKT